MNEKYIIAGVIVVILIKVFVIHYFVKNKLLKGDVSDNKK